MPPSPSHSSPKEWHCRGYLPHRDRVHLIQSVTFRLADSLPQKKLKALEIELEGLTTTDVDRDREKRMRMEAFLDAGMGCCALGNDAMAETMQHALLKFHGERYELIAWCIMPNHVHVLVDPWESLSKIVQSWKSYTGRWAMKQNAEYGFEVPERSAGRSSAELELGVPRGVSRDAGLGGSAGRSSAELELGVPRGVSRDAGLGGGAGRSSAELELGVPVGGDVEMKSGVPGGKKSFWMRDYWDRYIRSETHLKNVIDYIHQNPVKAGLCSKAEDWKWSSCGNWER